MIIYEQADASARTLCGAIYSWILDRPDRATKKRLTAQGWKPVRGALVTNDPDLVVAASEELGIDVVTNGTHAVVSCPGILCVV